MLTGYRVMLIMGGIQGFLMVMIFTWPSMVILAVLFGIIITGAVIFVSITKAATS